MILSDNETKLDLLNNKAIAKTIVSIIKDSTTPKAYEWEKQFCSDVDNIRFGLGFHPQLVAERESEIDLFLGLAKNSRYIGEIGLDFNSAYIATLKQQLSCFQGIAKACAVEGNKVLTIPCVKAARTVIDELEKAGTFHNNICIFHP